METPKGLTEIGTHRHRLSPSLFDRGIWVVPENSTHYTLKENGDITFYREDEITPEGGLDG